ncbi:hypothetical protein OVS_01995 [Mycoplasma ovis str. Michigan]|uniref:Transposase n=1 Tax=Mycoplasma ovis str. Michigan TaxID=1415773 RepID=A0ABM5P1F3_9MOLU|nr:hypothetical protein OVS_01995 [Mycoplasma ovis str. Michigan]
MSRAIADMEKVNKEKLNKKELQSYWPKIQKVGSIYNSRRYWWNSKILTKQE